ncbi:MAG: peptidylprolyl isomerase [Gemmataceae bacterium]|jgi:cyclophilin family peptidyl-prolyl cis-trans isomerase|nr:peptidylprolyl isomerase [Gemmataceae bacterium]RLS60123.1 MAG: peptidyl-prolyl cis-trans isomerase [Planctomycetota bacterium]
MRLSLAMSLFAALTVSFTSCAFAQEKRTVVNIETSLGNIKVELNESAAPISVKNFLSYVDDKFYDGTIFHRVIADFMIQGGGFETGLQDAKAISDFEKKQKKTKAPIKNESGNGLSNVRGSIAMARTSVLDSATSQFFINTVDNAKLDQPKYCVFGKVIDGMDVVDKIRKVETMSIQGQIGDVPTKDVVIKSVTRVK